MLYTNDQIIEKLRFLSRCRSEAQKMAKELSGVKKAQMGGLIRYLTDAGESVVLGNLLIICSINRLKIDPVVLVESLKVVDEDIYFIFAFIAQDEKVIQPLLDIAQSDYLDWDRKATAMRLAAELAVRFDQDKKPVQRVLWKLTNDIHDPELKMIFRIIQLILEEKDEIKRIRWFSQLDTLEELPEEKPPVIIGGDYTVRRPVPKLNRNAPCHCGSGKKYKHCCYEKDQKLLREASQYEGLTKTQVLEAQSVIDDTDFIDRMHAYELNKLNPSQLNKDQLFAAYRRAERFGLREICFNMLFELRQRRDQQEFAVDHFVDLLHSALSAIELPLAQKIRKEVPEIEKHLNDEILFRFSLLENPQRYEKLEKFCLKEFRKDEISVYEYPLLNLCFDFEKIFPALSVIFGRAAILGNPDRDFDNEMIIDAVRNARIDLNVDPWDDPVEEYYYEIIDEEEDRYEQTDANEEFESLRNKVTDVQRLAAEKNRELKQKEMELEKQIKKYEKLAENIQAIPEQKKIGIDEQQEMKDIIENLRRRVKNLKVEIKTQQQERLNLRKQLQDERKKETVPDKTAGKEKQEPEKEEGLSVENFPEKILIPEFSDAFQRSCEALPSSVVAKAVRSASAFAVHDKIILKHVKMLEALPGYYRVRIGLHYRMLVQINSGTKLEILDLIPRENLTTWIKQRLR